MKIVLKQDIQNREFRYLFKVLYSSIPVNSKKDMQSKIMNAIYSEENDKKFRNRVSEMFPDIELGPDGYGFDMDKDSF